MPNSSWDRTRFDSFGYTYRLASTYDVSKISPTGQEIWKTQRLGTVSPDEDLTRYFVDGLQFLLDGEGNSYLYSPIRPPVQIDAEIAGIFAAKITQDGVIEWQIQHQLNNTASIEYIGGGLSSSSTFYIGLSKNNNTVEILSVSGSGVVSSVTTAVVSGNKYHFYVSPQDSLFLHSDAGVLIQFNVAGQRIGEIYDVALQSAARTIIENIDGTIYLANDSGIFKYSMTSGLLWSHLLSIPSGYINVKTIVGPDNDIIAAYSFGHAYDIVRLNSAGQQLLRITPEIPRYKNKTFLRLDPSMVFMQQTTSSIKFDVAIDSSSNFYLAEFVEQEFHYIITFPNPDPVPIWFDGPPPSKNVIVSKFSKDGQLTKKIPIAGLSNSNAPQSTSDAIHVDHARSLTIAGSVERFYTLVHFNRIFE